MAEIVDIPLDRFSEEILLAVKEGRPSSFLRFNDGEARFVGRTAYYSSAQVVEIIRRHFGDNVLTDGELDSLGRRVIEAVRTADVVGLPPADWPRDFSCARDIVFGESKRSQIISTHVDFHQHLFNTDFFSKLFSIGRPVSAVTCRDVTVFLGQVYKGTLSDVYLVPEQADGSYNGNIRPHYPDYCDYLCAVLEGSSSGKVFLVGAGVCGKIYCEAVRRGGGVAIDVGSIFDLWAGRFSRPYMETARIRNYYLGRLAELDITPEVARASSEIYAREANHEAGIGILKLAQEKYPYLPEFTLRLVAALLRFSKQADALLMVAQLRSNLDAASLLVLGRMLKENGLDEQASSVFLSAFERNPLLVPNLTEVCNRLIARKQEFVGNRSSILLAAHGVASKGTPHTLLFQLARLHGSEGDYIEALQYCDRAIEAFSYDINYVRHAIGWLRESGGDKAVFSYGKHMHKFQAEPGPVL